jgi:hypothetical protein
LMAASYSSGLVSRRGERLALSQSHAASMSSMLPVIALTGAGGWVVLGVALVWFSCADAYRTGVGAYPPPVLGQGAGAYYAW